MPTSDARSTRPWRRFFAALAITLLAVVAADVALCLLLEPYAGSTELMWSEYRAAADADIDTVFVGSSATGYGLSPQTFDETLGSTSFNMGTPGQALHESLVSVKSASADHDLDRVVIVVGLETILEFPYINSSVVYTQAKCAGEGPLEAASDILNLVTYDYYFSRLYSLSCAFPWTYDHVELTWDAIGKNVERRIKYKDVTEAARLYAEASGDEGWGYWGQGYDGYTTVYPTEHVHGTRFTSHHREDPVIDDTLRALDELCTWCEEAGIRLYVVGAPYIPSAILEYGDAYWTGMAKIQETAERHGACYFDLNMCRRDVYDPARSEFYNQVHLNHEGAEKAGRVVASLIGRVEHGEDISDVWHPHTAEGYAAWLAELAHVDSVDYDSAVDGDSAVVDAHARTGSATEALFRFEVADETGTQWRCVRDWDTDPHLTMPMEGKGDCQIRISARAATDSEDNACSVVGYLTH